MLGQGIGIRFAASGPIGRNRPSIFKAFILFLRSAPWTTRVVRPLTAARGHVAGGVAAPSNF